MEKKDLNDREQFLQSAMEILTNRPEANVMIIVDGRDGLHILQQPHSIIWAFGLLAATEKLMDERYRHMLDEGDARMRESLMQKEAFDLMKTKGGMEN